MNVKRSLIAPLKNTSGNAGLFLLKSLMLCLLFPGCLYAQVAPEVGIRIPIDLKPTPEAAGLGKYGNIPVSYYTGTPDISIPLFEINDGDFTLPIKLSYHASGIKVNDVAGWAGLGWSLISGGVINRKVNHMPDEDWPEQIPTIKELMDNKKYDFLLSHANRSLTYQRDLQPDEFTYSFLDYNGKFYLDRDKKAYLNPHNDLKIEFYDNFYFKIKTPDGYQYIFRDVEGGLFNSPSINAEPTEINYTATTSWFLSRIVSSSGDTICRFTYEKKNSSIEYADIQYYSLFGRMYNCVNHGAWIDKIDRYETSCLLSQNYLKEISFNLGKIVFETSEGRKDKNKNGLILDAMKVYAGNNLKKWITFAHDYFYSNKGTTYFSNLGEYGKYRLKLTELSERDINGNEIGKYRFDYNPELLPPYGNFGIDIWGFYNGYESNSTLAYWFYTKSNIDSKTYGVDLGSNHRNPDEEKTQACMLTRIYYPTKGYTEFEYESNRHDGTINNIPHIFGGLRIRSIKNYDYTDRLLMSKEYKYGQNEDGFGKLTCLDFKFERNGCPKRIKNDRDEFYQCRDTHYMLPVFYDMLFIGSHPMEVPSLNPNEVIFYPYVTEYIRDENGLTGKKCFVFDFVLDDFISQDNERIFTNYRYSNMGWRRGNLLQENIYEGTNENEMHLVYQKDHVYKDFNVGRIFGLSISSLWTNPDHDKDINNFSYYSMYQKYEYSGLKKVIETTERLYTSEGTISKKTKYNYGKMDGDINFTQPTEITEYIDRDSIRTDLKYPFDFSGYESDGMKDRYMLPVIEKQVYKNNVFISGIKTNYMKWLNHYVPSSIETRQGTAAPETRIRFVNYNKGGKPVYVIKDDYTKIVYLWGYHNQYPVAEIKNATYEEVLKVLSADKLEYIANSAYDANQTAYYLNQLYEGLPNAQIKLSDFDPIWGVKSETDPRKNYTLYDYDAFGRLKNSYYRVNGANQLIESYDYHYKP